MLALAFPAWVNVTLVWPASRLNDSNKVQPAAAMVIYLDGGSLG